MSHKQQVEQAIEQISAFIPLDTREEIFKCYSAAIVLGLVIPYFVYLKLSAEYKRQRS